MTCGQAGLIAGLRRVRLDKTVPFDAWIAAARGSIVFVQATASALEGCRPGVEGASHLRGRARPADYRDHVALIRDGVRGATPGRWLELGAGEGAFTLALADLLGPQGSILALDRDAGALARLIERASERFPATHLKNVVADFTRGVPDGPFAGILAANSLHFVPDLAPVLASIRSRLAPDGRLVVVEYDADRGNPWVPHPFSLGRWTQLAAAAGLATPRAQRQLVGRPHSAGSRGAGPGARSASAGRPWSTSR